MRHVVLLLGPALLLAGCAAASPPSMPRPSPVATVVTTEPFITGQTPASTFNTANPNVPFGSAASYPRGAAGMGRTVTPAF